jgi:hypothetical protein
VKCKDWQNGSRGRGPEFKFPSTTKTKQKTKKPQGRYNSLGKQRRMEESHFYVGGTLGDKVNILIRYHALLEMVL